MPSSLTRNAIHFANHQRVKLGWVAILLATLLVVITYQLVSSAVWETRRKEWPSFQLAA